MGDKNGRKGLDKLLLARLARLTRAGCADLCGLGLRDVCERVLNGA
jgi:hypothetical protein